MSGAAGLSAARRRRAGGSETPLTNEKIQQGQLDKSSSVQKTGLANQITPYNILRSHENRLNTISDVVKELETKVDSKLESNKDVVYNNIETKVSDLETEMRNMKDVIQKIQSFVMEINVTMLNLQRTVLDIEKLDTIKQ